ncbi:hypothetical protein HPT27_04965 [Permianibacter sp. IMCC34836]|uniref:hypothetical protein n=1 Tax=Permianibacter fluminis TaxID=2738515 RepID=UPI001555D3FF|nr:hypothetical protein [Permianibacter fluminis]NQD36368.1 hypothetical protein [Permianibacter fluminis]
MDKRRLKRMIRYWEKCHARAMSNIDRCDWNSWFDLWHIHYDYKAKGGRVENKPYSYFLGYQLLRSVEERCKSRADPFQCFLSIHPDAHNDAVYMHTENPNPNSPGFPYLFEDVEWGVTDNKSLNTVIDANTHKIGKVDTDEYKYYIVIRKTKSDV